MSQRAYTYYIGSSSRISRENELATLFFCTIVSCGSNFQRARFKKNQTIRWKIYRSFRRTLWYIGRISKLARLDL